MQSAFKAALIVAEEGDVELAMNWVVAAMRGVVNELKLVSLSRVVR